MFSSLPVMTQDTPIDETYLKNIKDNEDALHGAIATLGAVDLPNGSFEIDSDADGKPDNWTISLYTGGSQALETTTPAHGAKALKFTHPGGAGNGGGYADSDYFPLHELKQFSVSGILKASVAGLHVQVLARFFDKDKVELGAGSPATLYNDQTTNPASYTAYTWQVTPPSGALFVKLRLVGGNSDKNQAGDVFFDGFTFGRSINNLDVQDNTITSAKINLTPISSGSQSLTGSGGEWVPPAGIYNVMDFTPGPPGVGFYIYAGGGWRYNGNLIAGGAVICDGSNMKFHNFDTTTHTLYYQKF